MPEHPEPSLLSMKRSILTAFFSLILLAPASAQVVSRIDFPSFITFDGLYAAPDGYIYAAGGFNKDYVYQISPQGVFAEFASGIGGPIHMAMDADGNLYVSSWDDRKIYKLDAEGGREPFADVDPYPTGLAFAQDGTLYVGHSPPSLGIGSISKVDVEGTAQRFAAGSGIDRPVGIAVDEAGNVYAANLYDTTINKITPSGEIEAFATALPQAHSITIGHLVYSNGYLYGADVGHNQVVRIDMQGNLEVFAGDGTKASVDGSLENAQFSQPNGITVSPDGSTLYVQSISSQNFMRTISLSQATDSEWVEVPESSVLDQNYPNPFNPTTNIQFELDLSEHVTLSVFDMMGRKVATLVDGVLPSGEHGARFNAGGLPGGAYIYRLQTGTSAESRVMTLLK